MFAPRAALLWLRWVHRLLSAAMLIWAVIYLADSATQLGTSIVWGLAAGLGMASGVLRAPAERRTAPCRGIVAYGFGALLVAMIFLPCLIAAFFDGRLAAVLSMAILILGSLAVAFRLYMAWHGSSRPDP